MNTLPTNSKPSFTLHLVDQQQGLVTAWQEAFADFPEVMIHHADLLAIAKNTIVSPANSYGYMDGGIDQAYLNFFGLDLQTAVSEAIAQTHAGCLPVGSSLMVNTKHTQISYLIVAPTMTLPGPIPPINCYYAMLAILQTAAKHPRQISQVFCPGLGTGVGQVDNTDAAREMALAYWHWQERKPGNNRLLEG